MLKFRRDSEQKCITQANVRNLVSDVFGLFISYLKCSSGIRDAAEIDTYTDHAVIGVIAVPFDLVIRVRLASMYSAEKITYGEAFGNVFYDLEELRSV